MPCKTDAKARSYWTRIGRLFPHEDGKGHDLLLNALPVNGRIVIRQEEPATRLNSP